MENKLESMLEKRWDKNFEKEIYESWKTENAYVFDPESDKPVYSIDTPPPYVNAPVHIGQATTYILMDMFARFKRMTGFEVLFPLGLDRNGLPIEVAAEKRFNVGIKEVLRDKFIEMCKTVLEESSVESMDTFLRLGISFNSWKIGTNIGDVYLTDSPDYRALTQATFIDLWNKGLIYEGQYPTNYCPGCGVTLADAEVVYNEIPTLFNDVVFKVKDTEKELIIATTRPELLCSCGVVIYHPNDERYKHLEGKTAVVPIYEKEVPIKSHPMADPEKGTGIVMMCSFGDSSDVRFFREMNLEPIYAINADGTMNENAGPLNGLKVKEARKKIIELLKEKNLLLGQKEILHRTPLCERSKDPIEFISMKEFYLKQLDFKDKMLELADKLNFYAPESRKILIDWINTISIDWPISKRRIYATEIPLWYCKKCGEVIIPPKGKYYQPWKENPPINKCKCGSTEFIGETRVFDTWFDSSITPLYILGYGRNKEYFSKHDICTLRPQGKEIIRTWLYYTLLKCYLLTNKCIFEDAWINYHIVDNAGKKMSKSEGNIINPQEVIEKFGAESFRLWAVTEGNLEKQDFKCSFDRINGAGKTLVKLWNVARFISMFDPTISRSEVSKEWVSFLDSDKWILDEINNLIKYSKERYKEYDFHNPVIKIKHFIWETFASHYIELVKNRVYNTNNQFSKEEQNAAIYTLHTCLKSILRLLSPIIPLFTYKIYKKIYNEDIHALEFQSAKEKRTLPFTTEDIEKLNSLIWGTKKEKGASLKSEIKEVILPAKFKPIEKEIKGMHNIKDINYTDDESKMEVRI